MAALVSQRIEQLSHIMRPHPISVREHVLSASGSVARLGQDQLGNRQCGYRTIAMGRILHLYRVGVNTFFMLWREGNHGLLSG